MCTCVRSIVRTCLSVLILVSHTAKQPKRRCNGRVTHGVFRHERARRVPAQTRLCAHMSSRAGRAAVRPKCVCVCVRLCVCNERPAASTAQPRNGATAQRRNAQQLSLSSWISASERDGAATEEGDGVQPRWWRERDSGAEEAYSCSVEVRTRKREREIERKKRRAIAAHMTFALGADKQQRTGVGTYYVGGCVCECTYRICLLLRCVRSKRAFKEHGERDDGALLLRRQSQW